MANQIIISSEMETFLTNLLSKCEKEVNIITAFCKVSTLQFVDENLATKKIRKRILVRFLPSDIIAGATDKEIYAYCLNNGWELYYDHSLHAKTYIFDHFKCIIGSANLTNKGIGLTENNNKEASTFFELNQGEYEKVLSLYKDAMPLDEKQYLMVIESKEDNEFVSINNRFEDKKIVCLFPEDFPSSETDLVELYTLKSFKWLVGFLTNKDSHRAYFGELTKELHDIFIKDPRYYRKDIKSFLAKLLSTIQKLNVPFINIVRPNHSELVSLCDA